MTPARDDNTPPLSPPAPPRPPSPSLSEPLDADVPRQRAVLSGGLWSAASMVVPLAASLVLSVVIGRRLGEEQLGQQSLIAYVQALLLGTLVLSSTEASMQSLAAARGSGEPGRTWWIARWSMRAHLVGGVLVALALVGVGLTRDQHAASWFVVAVTGLVDAAAWGAAARIVALEGWRAVGTRRLASQVLAPVLGIAAVLLGAGIIWVFVGQAVASTLLFVSLVRVQRRLPRQVRTATPPPWRPLVRLWSLFVLSLLVTQLVDRRPELVFLGLFSSDTAIGTYAVASTLVTVALTAVQSVTAAAMPAIATAHAAGDRGRLRTHLGGASRVVGVLGVLLFAGFATIGPEAVRAVYGEDFASAGRLVPWLSVALLLVPVGNVCGAYLIGTERLATVLVAGGTGALTNVALCLVLIPAYDEVGAVAAHVSAQMLVAVLLVRATWGGDLGGLVRRGRLARVLAIATLAGLSAEAVVTVLDGPIALALAALAFLIVGGAAARLLRLLDADDGAWLAPALPAAVRVIVTWVSVPERKHVRT